MGFLRQTWALTLKNLLVILIRKPITTIARALVLPVILIFVVSYSKNWALPATGYGVGRPSPVMSLSKAFSVAGTERNRVVVVDNGFKGGDIAQVVHNLSSTVRANGREFHLVEHPSSLHQLCPASILGVSSCFGAVIFHGSPDHGGDVWDYTLAGDESLGRAIDVHSTVDDNQIYTLPFQRAVDSAIAVTHGGSPLPGNILQFGYTQHTESYIRREQNEIFQSTLNSYFAFAFFVGICGITYHLTGFLALEREKGMSQLIEAMMPNHYRWQPQLARLLSYHISFDLMYGLGWILIGVVFHILVFPATSLGTLVGVHLLIGLSLASFSIFAGCLFRSAQLSGITIVVISLVLAIAAQYGANDRAPTPVVVVTGILLPPATYMYYLFANISFQMNNRPINLSTTPLTTTWDVTGGALLGMMAFQIFFFLGLAMLVERWIHSPSQRGRSVEFKQERNSSFAVRTRSFSKYYYPNSIWKKICCCMCGSRNQIVRAVEDLSLDLRPGSITVLLGANGSGKSTTLNAIAGVDSITKGTIQIDGVGGLGLCPQKNVMWDELTVYEHVLIFDLLKSAKTGSRNDRLKLINDCDLQIKTNAKAKTLSGGQKRKLQLSMMLVGGSRVCCVDEVSSGIDPLARRKVWDILLAERGRRSILLTTHFLDEADVLSDHIAILSKGSMRAQGSAAELKHSLGSGYRVKVAERLTRMPPRLQHFRDGRHTIFQAPDSTAVASLIAALEAQGIRDYQIEGPTIESVFLKIAEEMKDESSLSYSTRRTMNIEDEDPFEVLAGPKDMTTGRRINFLRQMWILLRKRCTILRSSYLPHLAAIVVPLIAAGMVTLFFGSFRYPDGLPCNNQLSAVYEYAVHFLPFFFSLGFVYGPPDRIPYDAINTLLGKDIPAHRLKSYLSTVTLVDSAEALQRNVHMNHEILGLGGFFNSPSQATFAWLAAGPGQSYYPAFVQNLVHNALMNQKVRISYESFQGQFPPNAGQTLQLCIYMGLAMAVYPALLALYPTIERLRNVRALHYSNGIRSTSLWSAYILFDFIFILVISVVAVAIWATMFHGWYSIGSVFVVFVLFGLASTALSYFVSLFAWSQLSAFAFSAGYQCAVLMLYYAGYLITQAFAPANRINSLVAIQYFTVSLVSPSCSLLRTLLLTLNEFSLLCNGTAKASNPLAMDIYGGPILYLVFQFVTLMAFVMWWDAGGRFGRFRRSPRQHIHPEEYLVEHKTSDVVEDPSRLDESNQGLRVSHISKSFGSNKAVDDISFGVVPSESFALLGPNGAGKSTLISLIRGDIRQSGHDGSVHIHGLSLSSHRTAARNHLGTCPQFDSIDVMSTIEHLRFYARARGVPDVEKNVRIVMDAVGLTPFKRRSAWALSGGNKRKLSLAIALVSNPAVLILDEPSSGMDAAAKRAMWKILKSLSNDRVLVITTHSMEEADELCDRAGIMAGRMLALGTAEELRKQYSDASYVHLVHENAPHTTQQDMDRMRYWIRQYLPEAKVEDRTYGGQLRFSVQNGSPMLMTSMDTRQTHGVERHAWRECSAGSLFQFLERSKAELGFVHYSVSAATLDEVFLSVVNQHDVEEENYAAQHGRQRKKVLGLF